MSVVLRGAAAIALVAFAAACGSRSAESAGRHVVEMKDLRFVPESLTVNPGDTILWINRDIVPHTATAEDGQWNTAQLSRGDSAAYVATAAGTFAYTCELHPMMKGTLLVR